MLVTQLCLTLWDPMDCNPPGSPVHGDSPGQNTGVGCRFLLHGIFPTQGWNLSLLHCRQILYRLSYTVLMQQLVWFKDLGCRWPFRPGDPQPRGHRLAPVRGRLGTRRHSRRWAASEQASSVFTAAPCWSHPHLSPASHQISRGVNNCHVLESSRSHLPCLWKNCLPWKTVSINTSHDCLYLEGHPGPHLDAL